MGYFKNTVIGLSWVGALRGSTRVITFVRIIILARLLTPAQFGVFGIGSLVLAFLEVITETGINVFLIQDKKGIGHYINDAWIVSILRGMIISAVIIMLAPVIAGFFNTDQAKNILYLISLVPFIKGFINPSGVKYQKELLFDKDFYLRLTVFFIDSGFAVILAFITRDATSFVWGLIAGAFAEVALSFIFIKPRPSLSFRKENILKIFGKGKWVTLFTIFDYFAEQLDSIIVGRMLGTASLGIYQMGYKVSTLPISEVSDTVNKVVFPVYSKIESDKKRLKKAFIKTMGVVIVLTFLFGFAIFFVPKELIIFVLGKNWINVIFVIKILVFYGILRSISGTTASLFFALGKQNYFALTTFVRLFVLAVLIAPLTSLYGIVGSASAVLLSVAIEFPFIIYLLFFIFSKKEKYAR